MIAREQKKEISVGLVPRPSSGNPHGTTFRWAVHGPGEFVEQSKAASNMYVQSR